MVNISQIATEIEHTANEWMNGNGTPLSLKMHKWARELKNTTKRGTKMGDIRGVRFDMSEQDGERYDNVARNLGLGHREIYKLGLNMAEQEIKEEQTNNDLN